MNIPALNAEVWLSDGCHISLSLPPILDTGTLSGQMKVFKVLKPNVNQMYTVTLIAKQDTSGVWGIDYTECKIKRILPAIWWMQWCYVLTKLKALSYANPVLQGALQLLSLRLKNYTMLMIQTHQGCCKLWIWFCNSPYGLCTYSLFPQLTEGGDVAEDPITKSERPNDRSFIRLGSPWVKAWFNRRNQMS